MKLLKPAAGDVWGGFAAMLVALPSAIAFGVTIYSPLGASYVAQGALAGILGVTALGLIAPALGAPGCSSRRHARPQRRCWRHLPSNSCRATAVSRLLC